MERIPFVALFRVPQAGATEEICYKKKRKKSDVERPPSLKLPNNRRDVYYERPCQVNDRVKELNGM